LARPAVDPADLAEPSDVYEEDGSSIGAGVTLTAVAGLHF
jgi:hypothetical protein